MDEQERFIFLKLMGVGPFCPLGKLSGRKSPHVPPVPNASPATREIALLNAFVAGFQYHRGMRPEVLATLAPGTPLQLQREPRNEHDERAIALHVADGQRLGYVPRALNHVPTGMIDQGLPVRARVAAVDPAAPAWERVRIELYLPWPA